MAATQAGAEALEWHRVFLRLRGHYAGPVRSTRANASRSGSPRAPTAAAAGVAITSIRQPLVDDVTVRQMGAVAYALSAAVDARRVGDRPGAPVRGPEGGATGEDSTGSPPWTSRLSDAPQE